MEHFDWPPGVIAATSIGPEGLPHIADLSLMTVTEHWVPFETLAKMQLVSWYVRNRHSFSKVLRYDLRRDAHLPAPVLTDEPESARAVFTADLS